VRNILRQSWFHGDISTNEANVRLREKPIGTFLIRFSSMDGWYTISAINEKGIQHQRIKYAFDGYYMINNQLYTSLVELVESRNFKYPCDGSKYLSIFVESEYNNGYL